MGLGEGVIARARRDAAAAVHSINFLVAVAALDGTLGASGTLLASESGATTWETVGAGAAGALGGTVVALLSVFAFQLVVAPYRQRDEARSALRERPDPPVAGPSPWLTPLERAIELSANAGRQILRERTVRGDEDLTDTIMRWATETDQRLEAAEAGALRVAMREDGIQRPHGVQEAADYLNRQLAHLDSAFTELRAHEQRQEADEPQAPDQLARLGALREEGRQLLGQIRPSRTLVERALHRTQDAMAGMPDQVWRREGQTRDWHRRVRAELERDLVGYLVIWDRGGELPLPDDLMRRPVVNAGELAEFLQTKIANLTEIMTALHDDR